MFNGIIKKTGKIKSINIKNKNCILIVETNLKFSKKDIGSSVSCSGVSSGAFGPSRRLKVLEVPPRPLLRARLLG